MLQLIVNGIVLGSIIALAAIGLTMVYGVLNFEKQSCDLGRYRPPAETHVKASPEPVCSRHLARTQASQHLVNGRTRAVRSSSHQRSYEEKHEKQSN